MATKKAPKTNRKPATKKGENEVSSKKMFEIPVHLIEVEPGFNNRIDYGHNSEKGNSFPTLMGSIKRIGVKEAIRVIPHPTKKGHYILREGHRRMKAVELINKATGGQIKKVPALIAAKETIEESLIRMITANNGKDLEDIEIGLTCQKLVDFKWSVKDIAEYTGLTEARVYTCLRLAKLPKKYHESIAKGEIEGNVLVNLLKEFNDNSEKVDKAFEEAKKRAKKESVQKAKEGKPSKEKDGVVKVTGRHFKGVGSVTTDRQKICNALKMADKNPDIYDSKKVFVVSALYGLLDNKATEQEIANMMKK